MKRTTALAIASIFALAACAPAGRKSLAQGPGGLSTGVEKISMLCAKGNEKACAYLRRLCSRGEEAACAASTEARGPEPSPTQPATRESQEALRERPAPTPFAGIGAALKIEEGRALVWSLIPGGRAAADGRLQPDDEIEAVAQGDAPWAELRGMTMEQIVALIRGPEGSIVRLRTRHAGEAAGTISLVRGMVSVPVETGGDAAPGKAPPPQEPQPRPKPLSPQERSEIDGQLLP